MNLRLHTFQMDQTSERLGSVSKETLNQDLSALNSNLLMKLSRIID